MRGQGPRSITAPAELEAWSAALGPEHVITSPGAVAAAQTATFRTSHSIPVILRPANRGEVQECFRVANRFGVPLYPVSSGKNWGYGSRVPAADGCALLDLGRLNRIADFDEDLAYVTVEPGVTQAQLFQFLRERGSKLWLDVTGSSPDCSLIGNTVERGFGHTPYGDHFANACGLEVVLPTGECIDTGFARFPGAAAAPVYRWGVGPSVDGLFTQSNFGVVTRASLWLMPEPEYFQAFYFKCDEHESLGRLIDALRRLRLAGVIRSSVHVGNDYKVLAGLRQYPWRETGGKTPLAGAPLEGFRDKLNFGCWNGSGGLYGSRRQVAEARRLVRKALGDATDRLQFLDDRAIRLAMRLSRPLGLLTGWDLSRALDLVKPVYGLMKGVPTDAPLASAYWRKRAPAPAGMDPDRDRCGLLWCSPVAPAEGTHALAVAGIANSTLLGHGFEPMISMTLVTDRAVACVVSVCYDREIPGEDQRAMECHRDLIERLRAGGYYPYRLGIQSMADMAPSDGYSRMIQGFKDSIDPNRILAPGRYEAAKARSAGA